MSYVRLESGKTKWVGKIKKYIECGNQEIRCDQHKVFKENDKSKISVSLQNYDFQITLLSLSPMSS